MDFLFKFEDNNDKRIELQKAIIAILDETITKHDKTVVQIANLLHIITPRLLMNSNESNVEDTHIHNFVPCIIKLAFGIEEILSHQWANSRLNQIDQNGKFKSDYIAYVKTLTNEYLSGSQMIFHNQGYFVIKLMHRQPR
ncbi:unnamed protein product [Rhizopus microsporus]